MMRACLAALVLLASLARADVDFTGDALADFVTQRQSGDWVVVSLDDAAGEPDVGVPVEIKAGEPIVSGWDVNALYFQYNPTTDDLHIGVDCYGICGDADGRLGPDVSSPQLLSIGGQDLVDLSGTETFALMLRFNPDHADAEIIMGVPGGSPPGTTTLACFKQNYNMASCFGAYEYLAEPAVVPSFRFRTATGYTTINRTPHPSAAAPDLEWTLRGVSKVRGDQGTPFAGSRNAAWSFGALLFAGSFNDAGVGEDWVPEAEKYGIVKIPCSLFDACGVCLGDSSSCKDCKGEADGPAVYDACGVCAGDGQSCADCAGVPRGTKKKDACGVCGGDGKSCSDCAGVAGGPAVYDVCDVCNGHGDSCRDCMGVPKGSAYYDVCDQCTQVGGTAELDCLDCLGFPFGTTNYDACDVCGGDGSSCLDCFGVLFGNATYDICDVCGGDGSSCKGQPGTCCDWKAPKRVFTYVGTTVTYDNGHGSKYEKHHSEWDNGQEQRSVSADVQEALDVLNADHGATSNHAEGAAASAATPAADGAARSAHAMHADDDWQFVAGTRRADRAAQQQLQQQQQRAARRRAAPGQEAMTNMGAPATQLKASHAAPQHIGVTGTAQQHTPEASRFTYAHTQSRSINNRRQK